MRPPSVAGRSNEERFREGALPWNARGWACGRRGVIRFRNSWGFYPRCRSPAKLWIGSSALGRRPKVTTLKDARKLTPFEPKRPEGFSFQAPSTTTDGVRTRLSPLGRGKVPLAFQGIAAYGFRRPRQDVAAYGYRRPRHGAVARPARPVLVKTANAGSLDLQHPSTGSSANTRSNANTRSSEHRKESGHRKHSNAGISTNAASSPTAGSSTNAGRFPNAGSSPNAVSSAHAEDNPMRPSSANDRDRINGRPGVTRVVRGG